MRSRLAQNLWFFGLAPLGDSMTVSGGTKAGTAVGRDPVTLIIFLQNK
jgi:hypothetical protein